MVNFEHILSFIISGITCLLAFRISFKDKHLFKGIKLGFSIIGIIFLIIAVLNVLWIFGALEYSFGEFIVVKTILVVIEALSFFFLIYHITKNKNLVYLISLYILSILSAGLSFKNTLISINVISYLFIMLLFLNFILSHKFYLRRAGYLGIIYSALSIIAVLSTLILDEYLQIISIMPLIVLSLLLESFYENLNNIPIINERKHQSHFSVISSFLKYKIFIIVVTFFVLVSTIGIHEVGHSLSADLSGCTYSKAVIYEIGGSAHAESLCPWEVDQRILLLSGILLPIIVAIILILTGGTFTKNISYLILSFSLIISYDDLIKLNVSDTSIISILIFSVIILVWSVFRLSKAHLENEVFHDKIN